MCSQRRVPLGTNARQEAGRNGAAVAPQDTGPNEEELRLQVRNTLWQAALSGRLENIFPKALQAKEHSGETSLSQKKVVEEVCSDLGDADEPDNMSESSTAFSPAAFDAGLATPSNMSETSQHAEFDLEQLRHQARQTFCEAILSGKLESVMRSQGMSVPTATGTGASSSSSTPDIRNQVRATLEKASHNGRLNEVLAQHRAAKTQKCCKQTLEKVEDTRDIDQLLLEMGEVPTGKAPKRKRKAKKVIHTCGNNVCVVEDRASDLLQGHLSSQDPPKQPVLSQELQPAIISNSNLTHDQTELQQEEQLLGGWQRAVKCSRRAAKSSGEMPRDATSRCEIRASSDSWAELLPPSSAMQPLNRKAPSELAPLNLDRPALAEAPKCEARVASAHNAKICAKRCGLPPPPTGLPPPPPSGSQGLCREEPLRTIAIWPHTPESTPPVSPRNVLEDHDEVLVPIPIHLLADVQRLLRGGGQPQIATALAGAFGDVAT